MNITLSDPATAIATAALNAFAEFQKFLCTAEGQKLAADMRQLTIDRLLALLPLPPAAKAA